MLRLGLFIVLMLSGCVSSLEQLRKAQPNESPFQNYLVDQYLKFADMEADQYDWFDSAHFARKGLAILKGVDTGPENLEMWDLPEDMAPILAQARGYLDQVLTQEMKDQHPKEAAYAQFYFDCWLEQQEENWQTKDIAECRENFYANLDELAGFAGVAIIEKIEAMNPPPAPEPVVAQKKNEKRKVYFDFGKATLNDKTKRVLSGIVSLLKDEKIYKISLNGYTDGMGKAKYNLQLSQKRVDAIKSELVKAGIDANAISAFALGEVNKKDEIAKKENRAVEIVIDIN